MSAQGPVHYLGKETPTPSTLDQEPGETPWNAHGGEGMGNRIRQSYMACSFQEYLGHQQLGDRHSIFQPLSSMTYQSSEGLVQNFCNTLWYIKLQVHIGGMGAAAVTAKIRNIENIKAWLLWCSAQAALPNTSTCFSFTVGVSTLLPMQER